MRIAVDTTGGDYAPDLVIEGAMDAARERNVKLVLLGNQGYIESYITARGGSTCEVVNAPDVIGSDDEPVMAVRRKKESPMVVGCRMIAEGKVNGLVCAGNTGALMAAGMFVAGRLHGIERPALAPLFPTEDGRGVLVLDVGANMDARPHHLQQYALMGSLYAEKVLGRSLPRVALLNVGVERGKGNQAVRDAYDLLTHAGINFVGNIEARDLLKGDVDVVVCDGFTGNVVLKFMEGMASSLFSMMKGSFTRDMRSKAGALLLRPALRDFKRGLDYSEHGGAPLLGLKGIVVKCHGSSNALAIKNGIYQAQAFIEQDVVGEIGRAIEQVEKG